MKVISTQVGVTFLMDNDMGEIKGFEVVEWVLSNGLTVWIVPDSEANKVYGSVVVKAGAKHSPNTGIAHYFEHIMFKGTEKIGTYNYAEEAPLLRQIAELYSLLKEAKSDEERGEIQGKINALSQKAALYAIPNDFNNLIHYYGGAGLNAGTSYDYTVYYNSFSPEYIEHWCELNSERLISPVFRLFQSELETVYEEKNMYEDRVQSQAQQALFARIMAPHPYQYPIIGSTTHLKNPDLHGMRAFFEQYYVGSNMGLILSGPLQIEGLKELLERTFGKIPNRVVPDEQLPSNRPFEGKEDFQLKLPIPLMKAGGKLWNTVPNQAEDSLALTLLASLFSNSSKTGLLDQLTLSGKVLMAEAMHFQLNDAGFWGYIVVPSKGLQSTRQALKLVDEQIEKVKAGQISEESFQLVKQGLLRAYMKVLEGTKERHGLLQALFAEGGKPSDLFDDITKLEALSSQHIFAIARKYLGKNYLRVIKKNGRYPKDKVTKPNFEALQPPQHHELSPFARYLSQLPQREQTVRVLDFDKDAEHIDMGDRLRLFRVENQVNELYSLNFIFYRSTLLHPEQRVLAGYMELVGAGGLTAKDLNEALQRYGASLSFEAKDYFFVISLTGLERYLREALSLLQTVFTSLSEQPNMLKQVKRAKLLSDKAVQSSPNELSKRLAQWARYGEKAPYRSALTYKQMKQLKVSQLLADWQEVQKHELDIHYTGRRTILEVKELLQELLPLSHKRSSWEGFPEPALLSPRSEQLLFVDDPKSTQAIITLYLNLGQLPEEMGQAALLYDYYLGRGMGSLLFQEVREYRSLAYGVSSNISRPAPIYADDDTYLVVQMSTQADKAYEAWRLLLHLLQVPPQDKKRIERSRRAMRSAAVTDYPTMRMRSRTIVSYERQGFEADPKNEIIAISEQLPDERLAEFHERYILPAVTTTTLLGSAKAIDLSLFDKEVPLQKLKKETLLP